MDNNRQSPQEPTADELQVSLEASEEAVEPGGKPPVIMIEDGVVAAAAEHGQQDTSREQGGVLLGTIATGQQRTVVCVEAAVPAPHTKASRSQVTFTHDSWNDIYRVIDSQYPDKQIVGWYHTHPGFGIFLSEYDLFIHRNFFNAPWQIAYVIDPVSQESGCFCWQGSDITPAGGYNIYSSAAQRELPIATVSPAAEPRPPESVAHLRPLTVTVLAVLGVILALQLVNTLLVVRPSASRSVQRAARPSGIRTGETPVPPSIEPLEEQLTEYSTMLRDIEKELGELRSDLGIHYEWYTVKPGDSLWRIAEEVYGRGDMAGLIAAENGLDAGGASLEPGMRLRLPKLPEKADESE